MKPRATNTVVRGVEALLLAAAILPGLEAADQPPPALERIGTITHEPIREASGLAASRRSPGVFWTVADSGNDPHLYAIDRTGRLLGEYRVDQAVNFDWESIAVDDQGHLYIGDVGNNLSVPVRWVFQVAEPKIAAATGEPKPTSQAVEAIAIERTLRYEFPSDPFDVEGTFFFQGTLFLLSKSREATILYRLRLDAAADVQKVEKVCEVLNVKAVTGADVAADGRRLALCTYREVLVYELGTDGVNALERPPSRRIPFQAPAVESCAWEGDDLLLVSEDRSVYRMSIAPPVPHGTQGGM